MRRDDICIYVGPANRARLEAIMHSTPTSASWLNLVERFFAKITQKRIRRGAFRSVAELKEAIHDYLDRHNADPKPFACQGSGHRLSRFPRVTYRVTRVSTLGVRCLLSEGHG